MSEFKWELHFKCSTPNNGPFINGFITHESYFKAIEHKCLEEIIERYRKSMEKEVQKFLAEKASEEK